MSSHYHYNVDNYLSATAARYPNKVAIVDQKGERTTTFAELNELAQRMGSKLCALGLERQPVLVIMHRSMELAACFAGITKSNNFYATFDEDVPRERLLTTLERFAPRALIVRRECPLRELLTAYCAQHGAALILVEDMGSFEIDHESLAARARSHIDTDLLYVLFTSGSTGEPKGVSICHRSTIDYIEWICSEFEFSTKTAFLNQAPFFFDNSITDIYVTFKVGACMHLIPSQWYVFPAQVMQYMCAHQITTIFWVPTVISYFASEKLFAKYADGLKSLSHVMFGGEFMPTKKLNIWRRYLPWCTFSSLYGPTEITDVCTYYTLDREFSEDEIIPIGKACANTQILVFAIDENESSADFAESAQPTHMGHDGRRYRLITPQNVGEKGVLFIRGSSLSLGYYGMSARSAESFIQNPLHNNYRDLVYNSGDIVAYNERGELICYGRVDNQIKHFGHRVDLGEIETAVNSHPEVESCACIFAKSQIYLFYQAKAELDLRCYLKDKVPHYMIPEHSARVESFAKTANGKIDRVKLKESLALSS